MFNPLTTLSNIHPLNKSTWFPIDIFTRHIVPTQVQTAPPAPVVESLPDWDEIDFLLDHWSGKQTQVDLRKWAKENGWTGELLDAGSRNYPTEQWFASLYEAERILDREPTIDEMERWETGGAEAYWLRWRAAYANRQIATICLCFIRTRARREAVKS